MRQMPAPLIRYMKVVVDYEDKRALEGIDLDIPGGRVTVIIGPSGCGKSTTLRCLNRLVPLKGGSILFDGVDIVNMEITALRRRMGYAIQNVGLIPHLTVMENITLVPRITGWSREKRVERARELLALIGLDYDEYSKKYPNELSGGEAQRVGVARALGADPPVLLLDEPFGAVDPMKREELQDEFVRIQRRLKKTVIFVTHDLNEAVRLADYLVIMNQGKILQAEETEQLLKAPASEFVDRFLGPDRPLLRLTLFTADRLAKKPGTSGIEWDRCSDGWIEASEKNRRKKLDPGCHTARPHTSLKECVSRLLAMGLPAIPVIDDDQEISGEVLFEDILALSKEV